jgi:endonuclease/exonuclease/phosphatase (EEP) superfamily protein YafD
MRVVVQNLQKRDGLASRLVSEHQPDVLLAQEINLPSESVSVVHSTSRMGYGTAIYGRDTPTHVQHVTAPYAEIGGFIHKKTTIATCVGVTCVSFHGYNGQPFKNVEKLVAHVQAVLNAMDRNPSSPALFAGDFNTWTPNHLEAVKKAMELVGFQHVGSWPYLGRDFPLDHVFVRNLKLDKLVVFKNESDHQGVVLELSRTAVK